jgi:hypothetical protein
MTKTTVVLIILFLLILFPVAVVALGSVLVVGGLFLSMFKELS